LETLRDVRALLANELGVDPGRKLQELEQDVLRQSNALEWAPPRDLSTPASSSQMTAPAPVQDDPATNRYTLPSPPPITTLTTTLVGRDVEIDVVSALAGPGALVTLTGPAGVGKTRLLLAVANRMQRPAWFIDLTAATSDDDVTLLISQALLPTFSGAEPLPVLAAGLEAATHPLVVLDGCEHVTDGVRRVLSALRRTDSSATFLLGSRRPTDLPHEQVHRLSPLPVPGYAQLDHSELLEVDAVRLFMDRARLARAGYEPTRNDTTLIGKIVTAVDGLPLAIELAASLLDVDTPSAVLQRLEGQLGSMPHARFSLPTRERTLAAAIDASASALPSEERDLLAALGVFAGQFDLDGAAAVADAPLDQTYSRLVALTRQSLVVSVGDGRFHLLAPVRSWARSIAVATLDVAAVRQRHAIFLCGSAWAAWEQGGGTRHRGALRGLATVLPDARSALEWSLEHRDVICAIKIAVSCSWVWTLSGNGEDGLRELLRVKELADSHPTTDPETTHLRAALLRSIGLVANPVGRLELAADVCAEAADCTYSSATTNKPRPRFSRWASPAGPGASSPTRGKL
jgi:predicted ATPase